MIKLQIPTQSCEMFVAERKLFIPLQYQTVILRACTRNILKVDMKQTHIVTALLLCIALGNVRAQYYKTYTTTADGSKLMEYQSGTARPPAALH